MGVKGYVRGGRRLAGPVLLRIREWRIHGPGKR